MTAPGRRAARTALIACLLVSSASADDRVPLRVLVRSTDVAPGVTPVQAYSTVGAPSIAADGPITFSSWVGTFRGFEASFQRVLRSFQPAPDLPAGVYLSNVASPWPASGGVVGLFATLSGSGYENGRAIFSGPLDALRLVARTGAPAPDAGGAILGSISDNWIVSPPTNGRGEVVFPGTLGNSSFDSAIWVGPPGSVRIVARRAGLLPGRADGARFAALDRSLPTINESGTVAFAGEIACGTNCYRGGVWMGRAGDLVPVLQPDDPAPGLPDGYRIYSFSADSIPALDDRGAIAVVGSFMDASSRTFGAIWVGSPGSLALLARAGIDAPGAPPGVKLRLYSDWSQPWLTDDGEVVFVGVLEGPDVDPNFSWGIWKGRPGDLRLLVRAGEPAPGLPDGIRFGNEFLDAGMVRPSVNGRGRAAFFAAVSGPGVDATNRYGVWAIDADERVRLVLRYGDEVEVAPGDVRIVRSIGSPGSLGGQFAGPPSLTDDGRLALTVGFTDGTGALLLATLPESLTCGDGVVDAYEACDQGAGNGSGATCCTSTCSVRPAGTVCRSASGACDVAETCTGTVGTCPADAYFPNGSVCRPSASDCDVAESCSGSAASCPADGYASDATVCRAAAGDCDVAESCSGSAATCPTDGYSSSATVCRAAAGVCDVAEHCTGGSRTCPADAYVPSSSVCRPSAGDCDVAERCSGTSGVCPGDARAESGTPCRAAAGACDVAEACNGTDANCPADVVVAAGTTCRAAAGVCDVAEKCNGTATSCPGDGFAAATTACRPAAGACDAAEHCTGAAAACPTDRRLVAGTTCRAVAGVCDLAEKCDGASVACPGDAYADAVTICRPAADACDVPESCTGSSISCPADTGLPDGDEDGTCDVQDNCRDASNEGQGDGDADGIGDACDPCTHTLRAFATKELIRVSRLTTPPGDDVLSFRGTITVPTSPAIDPRRVGVRVLLDGAAGAQILDATIPGGAYDPFGRSGWTANPAGTRFVWRDRSAKPVGGLTSITVRTTPTGVVTFSVTGKSGRYPVGPADLPLRGTFVVDSPIAAGGQCGETNAPPMTCARSADGATVVCK